MINRNIVIWILILAVVVLGLMFVSTMTGNVITGAASNVKVVSEEYFRISDFGCEVNETEVENNGENIG